METRIYYGGNKTFSESCCATWWLDIEIKLRAFFIQLSPSVNRPTVIQLKQYPNRRHRILQLKSKHKSLFKKSAENILHLFIHKTILLNVSWSHFHDNCDIHFHFCYVLLTVNLSIFILVINELDAQNFCFTISLFHSSACFEHHVLTHHTYRCIDTRGCIIQFWTPDDEYMVLETCRGMK